MEIRGQEDQRLLTIYEVAAMLRVSPSTAKKWAAEGKLPGALPKIGRVWRIREATFLEYLGQAKPEGIGVDR